MGSSSPAGDGTQPPALGARNLSCWATREAQTLHFWQAPRCCCTCCRSVAHTQIRESLCHFPKAGEVCLCVHVVGRGLATSHSVPLLPLVVAWHSTHFPNLTSLIFFAPGGPVWGTLVPLFHRWRGCGAGGVWQAQGHVVHLLHEPWIETRPPASQPRAPLSPEPASPEACEASPCPLCPCPLAWPPKLALSL